jgi:chromosome partitioning protein
MAAKIITMIQQKGGTGKTTISINLATLFFALNWRVGLIDADPQKSLATWFNVRSQYQNTDRFIVKETDVDSIEEAILNLKDKADLILIDMPPRILQKTKLYSLSDVMVVPTQLSPVDIWASQATLDSIADNDKILMVLNRVPAKAKVCTDLKNSLTENNFPLAKTALGNRMAFVASMMHGLGVVECGSNLAAEEISLLATEICEKIGFNLLANSKVAA